jgi:hypothetical protein
MRVGDLVVWRSPDFIDGGAKLALIVKEREWDAKEAVIIKLMCGKEKAVWTYQLEKADEYWRFSKKQT